MKSCVAPRILFEVSSCLVHAEGWQYSLGTSRLQYARWLTLSEQAGRPRRYSHSTVICQSISSYILLITSSAWALDGSTCWLEEAAASIICWA